eukprot:1578157-Pleurochrysis_carterae.AAC.1
MARAIAWYGKQQSSARGRRRNAGKRDCVACKLSSEAARKEGDATLTRAMAWFRKEQSSRAACEATERRARKATQRWHARLRGL